MSKLNRILLLALGVLIVGSSFLLFADGEESAAVNDGDGYYAVYMTSGDIYFGKLAKFPKLALANAYTLQRNQDTTQAPFTLVKFGDAFWGPKGDIQLSEANVLWTAELASESQVVKTIIEQSKQ